MKKYILSMFMVLILMPIESIDAGGHNEGKKLTAASSGFEGREEMLEHVRELFDLDEDE